MDIAKVKDVLRRTVHQFEMDELDDLRGLDDHIEAAPTTEDLDTIEDDIEDVISMTDSLDEGNGVDEEVTTASFLEYLSELSMRVSEETGITDDEAWDAIFEVVKQLESDGELSAVPDVDRNTIVELAEWMSAAKACDLVAKVVEHIEDNG